MRQLSFSRGVLSSIFTLIFLTSACSQPNAESPESAYVHAADIQQATKQTAYFVDKQYIGRIASKQQTALPFEFSGRVKDVIVDSGDTVKKGQVLAVLDTRLLSYSKKESLAQLESFEAQLALNGKVSKRINTLEKEGFSSVQQQDELSAERRQLNASIDQTKAKIATINYQLEKAQLLAPYDGTVTNRHINEGEFVNASVPAFKLIKSEDIEIKVGVAPQDARKLTLGQIVPLEIDSQIYQGKLLAVGKQIDAINRTVDIRIAIDALHGFYDDELVKIHHKKEISQPGFWLPLSALTDGVRGQWNIFLAKPNGSNQFKVVSQTVEVHYTTETDAYVSGIDSDTIDYIHAGVHRLSAGQIVRAASTDLAADTVSGTTAGE